jgi:hypothetical protein
VGAMIDMTGRRFGLWTVSHPTWVPSRNPKRPSPLLKWVCICDCGTQRHHTGQELTRAVNGHPSRSCGCLKAHHGLAQVGRVHPVYKAWQGMRSRCYNKKNEAYRNYGGRGIEVAASWGDSEAFIRDMLPSWREGLTLDRKNNNGNYCKENCHWTTRLKQNHNMRKNIMIDTPVGPMTLTGAVRKYGTCHSATAMYRLQNGWPPWEAITSPPDQSRQRRPRLSILLKPKRRG